MAMSHRKVTISLVALCVFLVSGTVQAEKQRTNKGEKKVLRTSRLNRAKAYLAAKDKNGDGKLSRDELKVKSALFKKMDKNDNGFVSIGELLALPAFSAKGATVALDGKGNDILTFDGKGNDLVSSQTRNRKIVEPGFFSKPIPACVEK